MVKDKATQQLPAAGSRESRVPHSDSEETGFGTIAWDVDVLCRYKQVLLTTFRRNGDPVPTPVWFVAQEDRVLILTSADSGKVKRLRYDPRVTLAPCTFMGKLRGPRMQGKARLLVDAEALAAEAALKRRYRWGRRLYYRLGGRPKKVLYLEFTPSGEAGGASDRTA